MSKSKLLSPDTPIRLWERLFFTIGHCGLVFVQILYSSLVLFYFTDILGIAGSAAGIILLVARVWDGINDPMMGTVVDRTNTKIGRVRPWILAGGLLVCIFTVLLFTNPGIESAGGKIAWATFTYIGFGMAYTAFVIPLKMLPTRITRDRQKSTTLYSNAFIGTSVAGILAAAFLMKLIAYFTGDSGDMSRGYQYTAVFFSLIMLVTVLLLFAVKERDYSQFEQKSADQKFSLKATVRAIVGNKHFMGFSISTAVIYFGYYLAASTMMYYCIYNLGSADYYTPLTVCDYGAPIVAALALPQLVKKFDRRKVLGIAIAMVGAAYGLRYLTGDQNVVIMVILAMISGMALGCWNILFSPLSLDCALYSEYKYGLKVDGLFVSSFTLVSKVASGLSGAFLGFLLEHVGYVENAPSQTDSVLSCLRICATAGVTISAVISVVVFFTMYKLKNEDLEKMQTEIEKRNQRD